MSSSKPCIMCWGRPERPETTSGTELEGIPLCGRCGIALKQALYFLEYQGWRVYSPPVPEPGPRPSHEEQGEPSPRVDETTGEITDASESASKRRRGKTEGPDVS